MRLFRWLLRIRRHFDAASSHRLGVSWFGTEPQEVDVREPSAHASVCPGQFVGLHFHICSHHCGWSSVCLFDSDNLHVCSFGCVNVRQSVPCSSNPVTTDNFRVAIDLTSPHIG